MVTFLDAFLNTFIGRGCCYFITIYMSLNMRETNVISLANIALNICVVSLFQALYPLVKRCVFWVSQSNMQYIRATCFSVLQKLAINMISHMS